MTTRTNAIAAVMMASAVLLAVPAAAMDGEILIDQAKVNAGGITPGDAPGFPATLGRSGHYKLTGNLVVPGGKNGIEVTQRDVAIDLNGFTIRSKSPNVIDNAIQALNVSGLKVVNGTITGFAAAIYNLQGQFADVENMRLVGNADGYIGEGQARIRNSTIARGGNGIDCAEDCLIEQNVIAGNAGIGIRVSAGAVVLGNVIAANGSYGLRSDFAKTGYGNNVLFDNNGFGAQVGGAPIQLHPNVCLPACP